MDGAPRYPFSPASLLHRAALTPTAVEHYRNLWNFVHVVYAKEANGMNICNATTCPRMSAGP
jgi:hypothetical protein